MIVKPPAISGATAIILLPHEMARLAAMVHHARPLDQGGIELQQQMLAALRGASGVTSGYERLAAAVPTQDGQPGIIRMVEQLREHPQHYQQAQAILRDAAGKIGRLLDQATRANPATAAQVSAFKARKQGLL